MRTVWVIRRGPSIVVMAAGVMLALLLGAGAAIAQETDDRPEDQVVFTGVLDVPADATVRTAVIFDGPATVEGTVEEALVVFNGDVDITGTVTKDVVVFNGDVTIRSGARVGGDVVSTRSPTIDDGATVEGDVTRVAARFEWEDVGIASRFYWWLAYSVSTLVLGLVLLLVATRLDAGVDLAARERLGAAIGIGIGWFLLLPVGAVLLVATVVGLPLGLYTLLALAFLYTVGYTAGAIGLGRRFVNPPTSRYLAFLAGWGALRLLALIPVVGGLLFVAASVLGFGLLVVAARRRRALGDDVPMSVPPPPAPPVPV